MSSQQYYMSEIPVTMEDDQDWIKKISKKFKKAQIVEKSTEIGEGKFKFTTFLNDFVPFLV